MKFIFAHMLLALLAYNTLAAPKRMVSESDDEGTKIKLKFLAILFKKTKQLRLIKGYQKIHMLGR